MQKGNQSGGADVGNSKGARVFSEERWAEIARVHGLSKRELEITRGVFEDATDLAIAAGLGISEHTVRAHFRNLHLKLAVRTRASLVMRIFETDRALSSAQPPDGVPGLPHQRAERLEEDNAFTG